MKRVPSGSSMTWSMICSADCPAIGLPQMWQCGWPIARPQQAQVVVDLGDRADRRARVARRRLLVDRDRRRQALDRVDVRLVHLAEELARVGAQRLDVAALALGVDRVERERRLARPGQARDDHERVARQGERDVLAGCAPARPRRRSSSCRRHPSTSVAGPNRRSHGTCSRTLRRRREVGADRASAERRAAARNAASAGLSTNARRAAASAGPSSRTSSSSRGRPSPTCTRRSARAGATAARARSSGRPARSRCAWPRLGRLPVLRQRRLLALRRGPRQLGQPDRLAAVAVAVHHRRG